MLFWELFSQRYMFRLMDFAILKRVNQFGLYLFSLDRKMPILGRFSCPDPLFVNPVFYVITQ